SVESLAAGPGAAGAVWQADGGPVCPVPGRDKPATVPEGGTPRGPGLFAATVRRYRGLRRRVPGRGPSPRERPGGPRAPVESGRAAAARGRGRPRLARRRRGG